MLYVMVMVMVSVRCCVFELRALPGHILGSPRVRARGSKAWAIGYVGPMFWVCGLWFAVGLAVGFALTLDILYIFMFGIIFN